jgi:alkanesulfonate monooxygenase SsuD/methylene tetrahydromethanopterin reductase-like flavin-dependent oxidoreductase (luciferase family)
MKFGFGLITCQRYPGSPRTGTELYHDALRLVQRAEQLGFDSVWVSEHHFWDDDYMPSLLVFCAAAAAVTDRVTIGTGVLLAPLYPTLRLIEDAATVDLIARGRLVLGLGQGWMPHEFEALGVPLKRRHERFEETVRMLREAWSTGHTHGPGPGGRVLVTPRPAQPGGPRIWVGADSERGMRRAGRMADGFMSSSAFDPEGWVRQVRIVQEGAAEAGRDLDEFTFSLHRPTFAWHGPDAWERVAPYAQYVSWKYQEMQVARDRGGPLPVPPPLTEQAEADIRGGRGLVGEPEDIVESLSALQAVTPGELHFVARLYWPGMSPDLQEKAMEIFAQEVIGKV